LGSPTYPIDTIACAAWSVYYQRGTV